jgi:hypothetical protein
LQKALGQGAKVLGSEEYHFSFSGTMTRRSLIQHAVVRTPASISSYHPSSHWRVGPDGISAEGSIHTRSPCRAVLVHLVRAAPPGDHFPLRGRAVAAAFMGAARRAPSTRSSSPEDDASSELLSSLEEEYVGMCDRMRSAMPSRLGKRGQHQRRPHRWGRPPASPRAAAVSILSSVTVALKPHMHTTAAVWKCPWWGWTEQHFVVVVVAKRGLRRPVDDGRQRVRGNKAFILRRRERDAREYIAIGKVY